MAAPSEECGGLKCATGILQAVKGGTFGREFEGRRATGYMEPGSVGEKMRAYAGDDKESCGKVTDQAVRWRWSTPERASTYLGVCSPRKVQSAVDVDGVVVVVVVGRKSREGKPGAIIFNLWYICAYVMHHTW